MKKNLLIAACLAGMVFGLAARNLAERPAEITVKNPEPKDFCIENKIVPLSDEAQELPAAEPAYLLPYDALYYGFNPEGEMAAYTVAVVPTDVPVTFENITSGQDMNYEWTYEDASGEKKVSNSRDLTVTYGLLPDAADFPEANRFAFPTLSASSDETSAASYTRQGFLQAGGGATVEGSNYGLCVIDPVTEGTALYIMEDGMPLFGYNDQSDPYWSEYTFHEYYPDMDHSTNYVEHIRYGNFMYCPSEKFFVKEVHTIAYGKITDRANFEASIYLLNANFVVDDVPDFTSTSTKVTVIPTEDPEMDMISINCRFNQVVELPVDIQEYPFLMVAISGFHDPENVTYFSPLMSREENPAGLGMSWIQSHIVWGDEDQDALSWSPVANYTDDYRVGFYIMLDGAYTDSMEADPDYPDSSDGIGCIPNLEPEDDGSLYNLDGRRINVANPSPGIYVKSNGQKVVIK